MYNKLINLANDFDSQRIKNVIKGKKSVSINEQQKPIKSLNTSLNVQIAQFLLARKSSKGELGEKDQASSQSVIHHSSSRVNASRHKLTKSALGTIQPEYNKSKNLEVKRKDPLTPFDIKLLKEQIIQESNSVSSHNSSRVQKAKNPYMNDYSSFRSLSKPKLKSQRMLNQSIRDNSIGVLKLSPRMTEFYNMNKLSIMSIMDESERGKNLISKYPELNIPKQNSFSINNNKSFGINDLSKNGNDDYSFQTEVGSSKRHLDKNTFHFDVNLSKELNRYNHGDSVVKSNNEKFVLPSAISMLNKSLSLKKRNSVHSTPENEEQKDQLSEPFDLEKNSKLIVDPRMLDPSINQSSNNGNEPNFPPIINPNIYPKVKAKSYLRILELTKCLTEKELSKMVTKALEILFTPSLEKQDRK